MQSELQRIEVEAPRRDDHHLAIDHAVVRQAREQRVVQFRKVSIQRTKVPALNEQLGSASKDDCPEAVPFRFVKEDLSLRQLVGEPGEHRLDWRRYGELGHRSSVVSRCAPVHRNGQTGGGGPAHPFLLTIELTYPLSTSCCCRSRRAAGRRSPAEFLRHSCCSTASPFRWRSCRSPNCPCRCRSPSRCPCPCSCCCRSSNSMLPGRCGRGC